MPQSETSQLAPHEATKLLIELIRNPRYGSYAQVWIWRVPSLPR
jgi:hypothetical protein